MSIPLRIQTDSLGTVGNRENFLSTLHPWDLFNMFYKLWGEAILPTNVHASKVYSMKIFLVWAYKMFWLNTVPSRMYKNTALSIFCRVLFTVCSFNGKMENLDSPCLKEVVTLVYPDVEHLGLQTLQNGFMICHTFPIYVAALGLMYRCICIVKYSQHMSTSHE